MAKKLGFRRWLMAKKTVKRWEKIKTSEELFIHRYVGDRIGPANPKNVDEVTVAIASGYGEGRAPRDMLNSARLLWSEYEADELGKLDDFNPKDKARVVRMCRQAWSWSYSRRLCIERSTDGDGFSRCEQCEEKCPKIFIDHIVPVGSVDSGYLERLFCPSKGLQALCGPCHKIKTKKDLETLKLRKKDFGCFPWDT